MKLEKFLMLLVPIVFFLGVILAFLFRLPRGNNIAMSIISVSIIIEIVLFVKLKKMRGI